MEFPQVCKSIKGEIDSLENGTRICVLSDEKMAITEDGDILPIR